MCVRLTDYFIDEAKSLSAELIPQVWAQKIVYEG